MATEIGSDISVDMCLRFASSIHCTAQPLLTGPTQVGSNKIGLDRGRCAVHSAS
ncbi:hypothetical protein GGH99_004074, partial [Coemansia sp. RSA 1285]